MDSHRQQTHRIRSCARQKIFTAERIRRFHPAVTLHEKNRVKNDKKTTLTGGPYFPAAAKYGDELKNLVRACLNFEPNDRPNLEQIYGAAEEYVEQDETAIDCIMDQDGLGLRLPDDTEFVIGKRFDLAKHRPGEDAQG